MLAQTMSAHHLEGLEWMELAVLQQPERWDDASGLIHGACDWEFGSVVVPNEMSLPN